MNRRISVIIPAINEQARVGRAVQAAWEAGAYEVIVVDGGSQDDTCRRAERRGATIVGAPAGRARQQNAGAQAAGGEVFLFQHADCRLASECLRQVDTALAARPTAVAGAFHQRIDSRRRAYQLLAWGNAQRVRWLGLAYGDQGIFVCREAFERLGGFADVPLMEDVILMRSLRRWGPPLLLPGPIVVSPRRWQRHGVIRQTLRNWCLLTGHLCGISPATLNRFYARHDHRPRASRDVQPS
jgi:rSAM/selenodomain-associated transferase 2